MNDYEYGISEAVMFDTDPKENEAPQAFGHVINRYLDENGNQVYDIATSSGAVHLGISNKCMSIT